MAKLAIVDQLGLFLGIEIIDSIPDNLPPYRVIVPDECDIEPGQARWDPDACVWRFIRSNFPHALPGSVGFFPDGRTWKILPDGTVSIEKKADGVRAWKVLPDGTVSFDQTDGSVKKDISPNAPIF